MFNLPLLMIVMELSVYAFEPRVLSLRNVVNVLNQSSYLFVFACAQMVVILTRGFDLSLGARFPRSAWRLALAMTGLAKTGAPDAVVVAAGLAAELGSERLSASSTVPSSQGSRSIRSSLRSAASTSASGFRRRSPAEVRILNVPDVFSRLFYNGVLIPGVSIPITIAIVIAVALYFLLNHTTFGRSLYIIGNNPRAARVAGLPSRRFCCSWPIWSARCWRRSAG